MQQGKPLDKRDYTPRQELGARAWDIFCTANFLNFRIRPVSGQSSDWHIKLAKAGIDVAIREGNLRIAPHLHNTLADVDRLLQQMSD